MTMPDYIMKFYAQGAFFVWLVLICLPTVYHIGHFVYRFVFDVSYDPSEHAFMRWAVVNPDDDGQLVFAYFFPYFLGSIIAIVLFGLVLYFYVASAIILILVAMIYMARGVVRLRKALKKHIDDKSAHK